MAFTLIFQFNPKENHFCLRITGTAAAATVLERNPDKKSDIKWQ